MRVITRMKVFPSQWLRRYLIRKSWTSTFGGPSAWSSWLFSKLTFIHEQSLFFESFQIIASSTVIAIAPLIFLPIKVQAPLDLLFGDSFVGKLVQVVMWESFLVAGWHFDRMMTFIDKDAQMNKNGLYKAYMYARYCFINAQSLRRKSEIQTQNHERGRKANLGGSGLFRLTTRKMKPQPDLVISAGAASISSLTKFRLEGLPHHPHHSCHHLSICHPHFICHHYSIFHHHSICHLLPSSHETMNSHRLFVRWNTR